MSSKIIIHGVGFDIESKYFLDMPIPESIGNNIKISINFSFDFYNHIFGNVILDQSNLMVYTISRFNAWYKTDKFANENKLCIKYHDNIFYSKDFEREYDYFKCFDTIIVVRDFPFIMLSSDEDDYILVVFDAEEFSKRYDISMLGSSWDNLDELNERPWRPGLDSKLEPMKSYLFERYAKWII